MTDGPAAPTDPTDDAHAADPPVTSGGTWDQHRSAVLKGAGAGAVATVAMSAVMLAAQKAGLMGRQPPKRITAALTAGTPSADGPALDALSVVSHLGFGAACGAVFAAAYARSPEPRPHPGAGIAFGLGVWAVSYAGWLPALGILPPPGRDRPGRQATMVSAHIVYGAALAALLRSSPPHR